MKKIVLYISFVVAGMLLVATPLSADNKSEYSFYMAERLPFEAKQLIESFECFSKDDKQILYAYTLALKYRMEHLKDRDALVKSDLDYWRLHNLSSNIFSACKLNYRFDDIIEETLTPSAKERKILKKLRRVEGSIRSDGSSELSQRMSKYDKVLREKILKSSPKHSLMKKDTRLDGYDIKGIKSYKKDTIAKNIYDGIKKQKLDKEGEKLLFYSAYLREETLRNYDNPKKRHKLAQLQKFVSLCQREKNLYNRGKFLHNTIRKIADKASSYHNYYPFKDALLPRELEEFCSSKIPHLKLSTFTPKTIPKKILSSKKALKVKKVSQLIHLKTYLKRYSKDKKRAKSAKEFLQLCKKMLYSSGGSPANLDALKYLRVLNCLSKGDKKEENKLFNELFEDIKTDNLKEEFTTNILKPMMWWMMTIQMKTNSEGESKELEQFFNCNQTSIFGRAKSTSTSKYNRKDMSDAMDFKDSTLKYYASIFEDKSAAKLTNKRAIKAGIIAKQYLSENGKIKNHFNHKTEIVGMPKGGIKITFRGVPKGKTCSSLINMNKNDKIFFNSKTYSGIDYVELNGKKIYLKHFVGNFVTRECSKKETNSISFVKENRIRKHSYNVDKKLDSAFGNVEQIDLVATAKYKPDGFTSMSSSGLVAVSGNSASIYTLNPPSLLKILPSKLENSLNMIFSPDGRYLAVSRYGRDIHIYDVKKAKLIKTIIRKKGEPTHLELFLADNETIALSGKKIVFLNIKTQKVSFELKPKFLISVKSFNAPRIKSMLLAPDNKTLYIASDKDIIERYSIEKSWVGSDSIKFIDSTKHKYLGRFGAFAFDKRDKNTLIIASKTTKVLFYNIATKKVLKTFNADSNMHANQISQSDDGNYMLISGYSAFLWRLDNKEQLDILNGTQIKGGVFLPNSSNFMTFAKDIVSWKIK